MRAINKLCWEKKWDVSNTISFLRDNSTIKFLETETDDDAKILEDVARARKFRWTWRCPELVAIKDVIVILFFVFHVEHVV